MDSTPLDLAIRELELSLNSNSRTKCLAAADCLASREDLNAKAWLLLSEVSRRENNLDSAIKSAKKAHALDPQHPHFAAQLAYCLLCDGDFLELAEVLDNAKHLAFYDSWSLEKLAMAAASIDKHDTALFFYKKSLENGPSNPYLSYNEAISNIALGNFSSAEKKLHEIPTASPLAGKKFWGLAFINKLSAEDAKQLSTLANSTTLDAENEIFMNFALGTYFEKTKDYSLSFEHYKKGNEAKRVQVNYSPQEEESRFSRLKQQFDKKWARATLSGSEQAKIIFIVGMPRTGSTLVDRILSAHPEVKSLGELRNFGISVQKLCNQALSLNFDTQTIASAANLSLDDLGKHYVQSLPRKDIASGYVIDKNPFNFLYIPLIAKSLPNAKILNISRDAMDTCFSNYKQLFSSIGFYSYRLEEVAHYYLLYRDLLSEWSTLFANQLKTVSYEKLVGAPESETKALLDFLDLKMDESCLDFHNQKGQIATASAAQARKPIYSTSVGKWRRYENHLSAALKVLNEAGVQVNSPAN
uniref:tetratricopeptide repeat-containing sulfotransferase family protein n=1 Tax=Microbulbifer agarilyticus TaxID=260552 RepID=UPI000680B46B|nr:tetratricopeptide repeat-containing sulfotransferase family protein [Microbulbifer agarilyticus]